MARIDFTKSGNELDIWKDSIITVNLDTRFTNQNPNLHCGENFATPGAPNFPVLENLQLNFSDQCVNTGTIVNEKVKVVSEKKDKILFYKNDFLMSEINKDITFRIEANVLSKEISYLKLFDDMEIPLQNGVTEFHFVKNPDTDLISLEIWISLNPREEIYFKKLNIETKPFISNPGGSISLPSSDNNVVLDRQQTFIQNGITEIINIDKSKTSEFFQIRFPENIAGEWELNLSNKYTGDFINSTISPLRNELCCFVPTSWGSYDLSLKNLSDSTQALPIFEIEFLSELPTEISLYLPDFLLADQYEYIGADKSFNYVKSINSPQTLFHFYDTNYCHNFESCELNLALKFSNFSTKGEKLADIYFYNENNLYEIINLKKSDLSPSGEFEISNEFVGPIVSPQVKLFWYGNADIVFSNLTLTGSREVAIKEIMPSQDQKVFISGIKSNSPDYGNQGKIVYYSSFEDLQPNTQYSLEISVKKLEERNGKDRTLRVSVYDTTGKKYLDEDIDEADLSYFATSSLTFPLDANPTGKFYIIVKSYGSFTQSYADLELTEVELGKKP